MQEGDQVLLFGDIHNHNALGYGKGSLERSIEIARTHLDFFAFTGHSSWHDIHPMEGNREQHWHDGFERLRTAWPQVQKLTEDANRHDGFSAFLGFEWHSSSYGDHCVVLPDDGHPLVFPDSVGELRAYCVERNGLMIPHHLAYATGHRGVNWDVFEPRATPVVEIYSEHGNAEEDRGALPYFNHSMGGRVTSNTAQAGLARGHEFGFVASSDNHRGFPGAYGEGLMGVWASGNNRSAIMDAIRMRRTIALTGDRIGVRFDVNGSPMGSSIVSGRQIEVSFAVEGRDEIDVVELIVNGNIVHRTFGDVSVLPDKTGSAESGLVAVGGASSASDVSQKFQVRLEWGWGPWRDMDLDRVCDWEFQVAIRGGQLLRVFPCLQSGPFDEHRRHRIEYVDRNTVRVQSYTSRRDAYRQNPNQSVVLEAIDEGFAVFDVDLERPVKMKKTVSKKSLKQSSHMTTTAAFPAESFLWHRLVPIGASTAADKVVLDLPVGKNYVYLRVRQKNGQMAWASPVFVERGR